MNRDPQRNMAEWIRQKVDLASAAAEAPDTDEVDPQLLAALQDGTLRFGDLTDETLEACRRSVGTPELVDLLLHPAERPPLRRTETPDSVDDVPPPLPLRPWLQRARPWMALAACVTIVAGIGIVAGSLMSDRSGGVAVAPPPNNGLPPGVPHWPNTNGTAGDDNAVTGTSRSAWQRAVVGIHTRGGEISGVLIRPDGWILTVYHRLVAGGPAQSANAIDPFEIRLAAPGSPPIVATLYRVDPASDLALLKVVSLPAGVTALPYVRLADAIDLTRDCVLVSAAVDPARRAIRGGTILRKVALNAPGDAIRRQLRRDGLLAELLQTDIAVVPADDGAPLLDDRGALIGLTLGSGGATAWHVALPALRSCTASLPSQPEPLPVIQK